MARTGLHSGNAQAKELPKTKLTKASLKQAIEIFSYVKPYKHLLIFGMIALTISSVLSLMIPYFLGMLIGAGDEVSGGRFEGLEQFLPSQNIALVLFFILAIMALMNFIRVALMVKMGESALGDLRVETYKRIIRLPMEFFAQSRVGELQSRIAADLTQIQEVITSTLAEFINQVIILVGGITFLAFISWKLTLMMLGVFPILITLAFIFGKFIRNFARKSQDKLADTNTIVEESLQGIASVKAYTNEWFEVLRYGKNMKDVVKLASQGGIYRGGFAGFMILAFFGSIVAVVWYGTILEAAGEIAKPDLVSFVILSVFVGGAMGGFANLYAKIQKAVGSTERVFELLEEEIEPIEIENFPIKEKINGKINFDKIAFEYPSRKEIPVLKSINLEIKQGEKIAIVGPSGAGKSTITSLLLRYYKPSAGKILIDDKNIENFDLSDLRKQMAIVPQDVILFGGTIYENISYGKPGATQAEVESAAKQANAHEFIKQIPEKYQALVGERGIKLSGGQRQRIAIARALLKNPAILLLDEATSSLDSESEKQVQDALNILMQGRTSIIIAHRLSTIRDADKIAVLNEGFIVELGTHEALMQIENGVYRNLKNLQEEPVLV